MADNTPPPPRPTARPPRETQGYLFTLDGDDEVIPGLEEFFPEVPIANPADLELERSRRRFTQGA